MSLRFSGSAAGGTPPTAVADMADGADPGPRVPWALSTIPATPGPPAEPAGEGWEDCCENHKIFRH